MLSGQSTMVNGKTRLRPETRLFEPDIAITLIEQSAVGRRQTAVAFDE